MRVLAIIIDYKSSDDARKLSLVLAMLENTTVKVLHFDNGNQPKVELSEIQKSFNVLLLRSEKNLGYAGGLNEAIRRVKLLGQEFDAYWLLNSDLEITPQCLSRLVQVLNLHSNVAAVGPRVLDGRKMNAVWGARGVVAPVFGTTAMEDWKGGLLPVNSYIPGCSLLVRTKAFDQVGGLPSQYKLYFEETEFCLVLQRLGWQLWVERGAIAIHRVESMKAGIPARHFAYYFIRNNLIFWNRLYGFPWWIQLPRTLYVLAREVLLPLRRARSWSELSDRFKYAVAGLWDGVLLVRKKNLRFEKHFFE